MKASYWSARIAQGACIIAACWNLSTAVRFAFIGEHLAAGVLFTLVAFNVWTYVTVKVPRMPDPILKDNDPVIITFAGKTVAGYVFSASPLGQSLVLRFPDNMLGGYPEMMPVLWRNGEYVDLFNHAPVTIVKPKEAR